MPVYLLKTVHFRTEPQLDAKRAHLTKRMVTQKVKQIITPLNLICSIKKLLSVGLPKFSPGENLLILATDH